MAKVSSRCLHYFCELIDPVYATVPTWRLHPDYTGLCNFMQTKRTELGGVSRINSIKRPRGAYLIFGLSGWALIRGWALPKFSPYACKSRTTI